MLLAPAGRQEDNSFCCRTSSFITFQRVSLPKSRNIYNFRILNKVVASCLFLEGMRLFWEFCLTAGL